MDPLDLIEAIRELKRSLDPNYQTVVNNSIENASRSNDEWDTFGQYSRYTADEPHSSMGVESGLKGLSPPVHNFYIKESEVEDPNGEPFETEEEDPELKRKQRELQEIEEQIMRKKVAIALKHVEFVKEKSPPGVSCNRQSATCKGATLKDRVNAILQQRRPDSFQRKVQSPEDRMNSSSLNRKEDHPLKLRVKALMRQRCSDPCVLQANREVSDVTSPPPRRSVSSPAKEVNSINQGFQRFLSVLNRGVDMDLLSRIVNDDSEDLPLGEDLLKIQPSAVEIGSDPQLRSASQQSNSGDLLQSHSQTNSGERKSDPTSQERSLTDHVPVDGEEKKNDRGGLCFGSSSRSMSPLAVKKKKEEEERPAVDEQHAQLQNILKSLGLSLEVEEISKLADRTQERLYGKKHEGMSADSRGERESQQRGYRRRYSNSSSSSSSSSTSRSSSPSSHRQRCSRSHSRDSKQRRLSEHSDSSDRHRDTLTCQDDILGNKEAHRHGDRDKDRRDSKEPSVYQYQNKHHPHPAAFSVFPDHSLSQYSHYNDFTSDSYSTATNSYWTYMQGAVSPSLPSSGHPYPQNSYHHFPGSVVAPNIVHHRHRPCEDINLFVNPDLSKSEGQVGSFSGPRCLQVIRTKQITQRCVKQLTKSRKRSGNMETCKKSQRLRRKKRRAAAKAAKQSAVNQSGDSVETVHLSKAHSESEQSENEKQQPTEEEIKANLRKKLEAFNQKVKQKLTQPATSLTSQTS